MSISLCICLNDCSLGKKKVCFFYFGWAGKGLYHAFNLCTFCKLKAGRKVEITYTCLVEVETITIVMGITVA